MPAVKYSSEDKKKAMEMYKKGHYIDDIAEITGVKKDSIYQMVKILRIKREKVMPKVEKPNIKHSIKTGCILFCSMANESIRCASRTVRFESATKAKQHYEDYCTSKTGCKQCKHYRETFEPKLKEYEHSTRQNGRSKFVDQICGVV